MPPPKKTETRTEVLTEAELEAICAAHRGIQHTTRRHCLMWRFLFYQGLRPGEMYELRIRNVGLGAGEIQIGDPDWRQKSGQEDVIPLLPPGRFYARPFLSGAACVGRVPLAESGRSGVRRRLGCQPAILELQACRASGRGRRRDGYRSGAGRAHLDVHAPPQLRDALAPGGEAPHLGQPAPASQPSADHDGVMCTSPAWTCRTCNLQDM